MPEISSLITKSVNDLYVCIDKRVVMATWIKLFSNILHHKLCNFFFKKSQKIYSLIINLKKITNEKLALLLNIDHQPRRNCVFKNIKCLSCYHFKTFIKNLGITIFRRWPANIKRLKHLYVDALFCC